MDSGWPRGTLDLGYLNRSIFVLGSQPIIVVVHYEHSMGRLDACEGGDVRGKAWRDCKAVSIHH